MPERQLHLFAPRKPLIERLGEDFFRTAPRAPGVYIMTGRNERVLYVGQSGNLHARLASYKNAQPDRAPRKVIRLVHEVDSITWEKCESAEAARLRENELLRLHRPKFNSLNTYPKAYSFIWLQPDESGLEAGRAHEPPAGVPQVYGAFKTRVIDGFGALLRLIWAVLHQPASPHDYPSQLLNAVPPRRYRLEFRPNPAQLDPEPMLDALRNFLEGSSDGLLGWLTEKLPMPEALGPFHRTFQLHDLETLEAFFRSGPKRNRELRSRYGLSSPLISQEQLDDLLVMTKPEV